MEDVAMNLNLDPFWRSSVGFDRLFNLMDESLKLQSDSGFPPYNIVRTGESSYRITLAVAGFKPDQIAVTVEQNTLVIAGHNKEAGEGDYLYRGISTSDFERRFSLADFVEVKQAAFEDGLLQIELVRELPETMKPRRIEIRTGKAVTDSKAKSIDQMRAVS
jgi:molecular chaperone IbpA